MKTEDQTKVDEAKNPSVQGEGLAAAPCWAPCEKCNRPGILVFQNVIPNKWSEAEKAFKFAPRVFRYYLCRWHLAAENSPKYMKIVGRKKRVKLEWRPDAEVIEKWERAEKQNGVLTEKSGWQKLS